MTHLKTLYSGWLTRDDSLPWTINGIAVDPATRTRREEYTWAAEWVTNYLVLDAATGYIPTWHELPAILTRKHAGRHVVAFDANAATLKMPPSPAVTRMLGNLLAIPFADDSFDSVCCISTLEHLEPDDRQASARELVRVCKPGGRLILTADLAPWLPMLFGYACGPEVPVQPALNPPVYALAMEKQ